jgi:NAD(P)-dependent dehydrogenase (short-subunit alcohol dehydrogenase family)
MTNFENKICLVTGASSGFGFETSLELVKRGATVIAIGKTLKKLEDLDDAAKKIKAPGRIVITPLDLVDFMKIDELGFNIYQRYGRLDIMVANAASFSGLTPLHHIKPHIWQNIIDINLTANWRLIRSMDPLLRMSPAARVAFVGCKNAIESSAYYGAYSVSKSALINLMELYSKETIATNIKVNMAIPGAMDTQLWKAEFSGKDQGEVSRPEKFVVDLLKLLDETCKISGRIVDLEEKLLETIK